MSDPRAYPRKAVSLRTIIAVKEGLATAQVTNLSERGCKVRLVKILTRGQYLTLKLYPDNGTATVQIDLAKVIRAEEDFADVKFISISETQQERLDRLCRDQVEMILEY